MEPTRASCGADWVFSEMHPVLRPPSLLLVFLLQFLLCASSVFLVMAFDPGPKTSPRAVTVVVRAGSTPKEIAWAFSKEHAVAHPFVLESILSLPGSSRRIVPGVYRFGGTVSPACAMRALRRGPRTYVVSVRGGSSVREVAKTLSDMGIVSYAEFIEAATSEESVSKIGFRGTTGEGFLPPGTYVLRIGMAPGEIVSIMHERFVENLRKTLRVMKTKFSPMELVVMASIIEAETSNHTEKPMISGVFTKRLAIGMPLQADPTVAYGLGKHGKNLKRSDFLKDHPYNTYTRRGLPAGPIANPGLESLLAAARPAKTPYLYFLSDGSGSHVFSMTHEEHERKRRDING